MQCYTAEEIAEAVEGETGDAATKRAQRVLDRICKYEICPIPGQFTEDQPEDAATDKVKQRAVAEVLGVAHQTVSAWLDATNSGNGISCDARVKVPTSEASFPTPQFSG